MTEPVVQAESQLAVCVTLMRELLQSTAEDALPRSILDDNDIGLPSAPAVGAPSWAGTPEAPRIPDTLQQRLDWERRREEERIHSHVMTLQQQMNVLRSCVASLGGAVRPDGRYEDVPTSVLDEEVARLAAENSRLAARMIALYDEAASACASLEEELFAVQIPPI